MSHPTLGLPPRDLTVGLPAAAARLRQARARLAARALEIAVERDPTFGVRYDDIGLRRFLRDLDGYLERLALSVASDDPYYCSQWAEWVAPVFRRRKVPMDDLVTLTEAIRSAMLAVLAPGERGPADAALDTAIAVFRFHRRLGGDARRRNRILAAIYKGA